MSLFHSKSQMQMMPKSTVTIGQDIGADHTSDSHQGTQLKKKRTFFRGHAKSDSVSSLKDIMVVPRDVSITLAPASAKEFGKDDSRPVSPKRSSSTTRRLQKRPPSSVGSGSSSRRPSPNNSPAPSPSYTLDKPPRIASKDYTPAHQNLYIMDDGQDDEMYTLFEIISGTKPMNPQSNSSAAPSPELPMDQQRCELKRGKRTNNNVVGHSRNTSSSSAYSVMSSSTYQTEFSDFQFEFGGDHEKTGVPRSASSSNFPSGTSSSPSPNSIQDGMTFQRRHNLSMGIINEHPAVELKNAYEDCVASIGDLTTDDESDFSFEYGDEWDDVVFEEGLAIQMSIRSCSPSLVMITPRSFVSSYEI